MRHSSRLLAVGAHQSHRANKGPGGPRRPRGDSLPMASRSDRIRLRRIALHRVRMRSQRSWSKDIPSPSDRSRFASSRSRLANRAMQVVKRRLPRHRCSRRRRISVRRRSSPPCEKTRRSPRCGERAMCCSRACASSRKIRRAKPSAPRHLRPWLARSRRRVPARRQPSRHPTTPWSLHPPAVGPKPTSPIKSVKRPVKGNKPHKP